MSSLQSQSNQQQLTMTANVLQSRQLELTPAQKGLTSGLSIAAAIILILLGFWAYRRYKSNQTVPVVVEEENEKSIEVQIEEESTHEDTDVEIAESSSEEIYDRSISMCRSGTMNSLDVHTCASGSCDKCRKQQEPNFLGVKKLDPNQKGRIRLLPDRWWENPLSYMQQEPEVMQTIVSMSDDSEVFNSSIGGDESTLGESTLGDNMFRYEEDVIRD
jgi:cell division protein FtsL